MSTMQTCPQCGAKLEPEAPEGLCPTCMMKAGLPTNHDTVAAPLVSDPLAPAEIAKLFPQLEMLDLLGRGGMGVVYKARQKQLDRVVALKVLPPEVARDPHFAERFLREARALARLNHPNIVTVYEFGQTVGQASSLSTAPNTETGETLVPLFFLIMEFVDGVNLRQLEQSRQITPAEALTIIPKICDALQYAHEEGVVHRDIKPENILVDRKGRVKIADFGLAKLAGLAPSDPRLTRSNLIMGTPHYMAPEQTERPMQVDHRADIYSLGVVFYEMLTGELPIGRFAPPSQKYHLDVRLDEVVLKSLEKEPERRYQQVSEVKTAVEQVAVKPAAAPPAVARETNQAVRDLVWGPAVAMMGFGPIVVFLGVSEIFRWWIEWTQHQTGIAFFPEIQLVAVVGGILAILGGVAMLRLRWYGLAIAGAIGMATGAGVGQTPDSVWGFGSIMIALAVTGIACWALFALSRPGVREAFNEQRERDRQVRAGVGALPVGVAASAGFDAILRQVKGPAMGLLATAIVIWMVVLLLICVGSYLSANVAAHRVPVQLAIVAAMAWFITVATVIMVGAQKMKRLESYGWAVTASIIAILGGAIGLPFGIWALVVLIRPEVKTAFNRQSKPTSPPNETGWRAIALAVGLHAVMLLVIAAILVVVVPKFLGIFRDMEVTLPWLTRGVVGCSQFVLHGGFLLLPFLVAMDVLFCWLAQNTGGRKLLIGWTVAGVFGLGVVVAVVVGALSLPLQRVMETLNTQAVTTLKSFSTADSTISKDLAVEDGGWFSNCAETRTIPLFEVAHPGVEDCQIIYRAQLKTEKLKGRAYLEMWCRIPGSGESFSRSLDHVATGSTDWSSYETPFFLKKGEKPDLLRINLVVEGTGRVGIRNVEVLTNAKQLPAGAGAPSAATAQTPFTCTTNNGSITITKYTGPGGVVTIPSSINGLPVTSIGRDAFSGCSKVTDVTIPNGVTNIGFQAFILCEKLTNVTIPNSVTVIGDYVFDFCGSLTNVFIPASVTNLSCNPFLCCWRLKSIVVDPANPAYSNSPDGVLFNKDRSRLVSYPLGKVGSYAIPSSVKLIAGFAFHSCSNLTSITIPNSVTETWVGALSECYSLTNIVIPSSLTAIGVESFYGCSKLNSFTVDAANPAYSNSADGVLFNKDKTCLISYPAGKAGSCEIPNSVTKIDRAAFRECTYLTSVTIPESVTSIGLEAFRACENLTAIYFKGNPPRLDKDVFDESKKATIYYPPGTTGWGQEFGGRPTAPWNPQAN